MTEETIEISAEEAEALLDRVKGILTEEDYRIIKGLVDTHLLLNQAVTEREADKIYPVFDEPIRQARPRAMSCITTTPP